MTDPDRLDRIEALVEKIGQRVDSNARAIEALSANSTDYQRDRERMYQFMADVAQSQADLAQSMADLAQAQAESKREMYRLMSNLERRQDELSRRQADIVEITKLLVQKKDSQ